MLHPAFGVMNALFQMGGIIDQYVAWLTTMPSAMIWVIIAYSWKNIPLATLLILAGLQTIPKTLLEAAELEGANAWKRTQYITLPILRPTLTVVLIFETILKYILESLVFAHSYYCLENLCARINSFFHLAFLISRNDISTLQNIPYF